MIILKGFPLPPTSNNMYIPVRGRLIKSNEARIYDQKCLIYSMSKSNLIKEIKINETDFLYIETHFVFLKNRLFTKKNELKKLDCTNRIKSCHDNLCKMLNIDDKQFIEGKFSKSYCEEPHQEQVIIKISKLDGISDFKSLLNA